MKTTTNETNDITTTTKDLQDKLIDLIDAVIDARDHGVDEADSELLDDLHDHIEGIEAVQTYEDADVLTSDCGMVLRMNDGTEFQITIVRSR